MFATQDQDNRLAEARGLTRNHHGGLARSLRRTAIGAVCAAAVAVPLAGAATAQAATSAPRTFTSTWTSLALTNGWHDFGNGTAAPAVTNISGIVHLRGAIATAGTNAEAFILPVGDRPATEVNVPVDLSGATAGELDIQPSGVVDVIYEQTWSDAQSQTSLDGATFATSGSSFTKLTPQNGWTNYGPPYAGAAVRSISGIVHLEEPTAELDHEAADVVVEALREVSLRGGGVILASHDPRILLAADRVLVLRAGRVVAEGEPGEVAEVLTTE